MTTQSAPLNDLRRQVDEIDGQVVDLLNRRTQLALEIGKVKEQNQATIYDPPRETSVLGKIRARNQGPLPDASLESIYREIIAAARNLEQRFRVAFLGPAGTFTHQAAQKALGRSAEYAPCDTIGDVFAAIEHGRADVGVVPIENSTEGAVTHTLDELSRTRLKICSEVYLRIVQHLISRERIERIRAVYSNPHVFGQCRSWLHQHLPSADLVSVSSTVRAVEMAAAEAGAAAIAGALAAELHSVPVVARDIQDSGTNTTRFLVIGAQECAPSGRDKTSLVFAVRHQTGALYKALAPFEAQGLNLTRIESRPSKVKDWEYVFFVDFEGHVSEPRVAAALRELDGHCQSVRVLGSYPGAEPLTP